MKIVAYEYPTYVCAGCWWTMDFWAVTHGPGSRELCCLNDQCENYEKRTIVTPRAIVEGNASQT